MMTKVWSKVKAFIPCFTGPSKLEIAMPGNTESVSNDIMLDISEFDIPLGPVANDENLDPTLVVYIHGSFARNLRTEVSDINLYISSHPREQLQLLWSSSSLRQPSSENPSVGESFEEHLGNKLGREITIC